MSDSRCESVVYCNEDGEGHVIRCIFPVKDKHTVHRGYIDVILGNEEVKETHLEAIVIWDVVPDE